MEPLSIDEAFLDITNSSFSSGKEAAMYIKNRVKDELGLSLSIGISYNKFLAKLASDWNKPNGMMVITKEMIPDILKPLSISKIYGIGSKSLNKLNNMGMFKVEDLYGLPLEFFIDYFGKYGVDIYERIRGIDKREVVIDRDRKSYGRETTLKYNTENKEDLDMYIKNFSREISNLLIKDNVMIKTIVLKYKTASFENHTRSKTLLNYTNNFNQIYNIVKELIAEAEFKEGVRLIGVSVSNINIERSEQLSLF